MKKLLTSFMPKWRIAVDGNGRYWVQQRWLFFFWRDYWDYGEFTLEQAIKSLTWVEQHRENSKKGRIRSSVLYR